MNACMHACLDVLVAHVVMVVSYQIGVGACERPTISSFLLDEKIKRR